MRDAAGTPQRRGSYDEQRRQVTIAGCAIGPLDRPPRPRSQRDAGQGLHRTRVPARGTRREGVARRPVPRDGRRTTRTGRGLLPRAHACPPDTPRPEDVPHLHVPARRAAPPLRAPHRSWTSGQPACGVSPCACAPAEALGVQPVGLLDDVVARQRLHLARLRLRALLGDPALLAQLRVKASVSGRNWQLWALAEFSRCGSTRAAELERRRANSASSQPARAAAGPYCDNSPITRKGLA
jgi:hypothetical protein